MNPSTEFERLLELLRCGNLNSDLFVRYAKEWSPDRDPPFIQYISQKLTDSPTPATPTPPADPDSTASVVVSPYGVQLSTISQDSLSPTQTMPGATLDISSRSASATDSSFSTTRYLPTRLYRSGGLGSVWLARDTVIGRDVALKIIRSDRTVSSSIISGFIREAQLTGRLEHPCIVPVYDLPETRPGDTPSYVMRFVVGRTLAEAAAEFQKGPPGDRLVLASLLDAVVSVSRAVSYAHSKGILHRDLKGQNVAIGEFGEVFLLDWGLAIDVEESSAERGTAEPPPGATPRGSVVGTPSFMAPEVIESGIATKLSDVYGLGGTLYQVLTGKAPYTGPTPADVIQQIRKSDPVPVRKLNPAIPPALAAICHKALARDLNVRYPSAEDFATDLRRFLADEPVRAYRESWLTRAGRWAKRHRTLVAVLVALVPTVTVGSIVATILVWQEKQNTEAEFRRASQNFIAASGLAYELGARISNIETGLEDQKSSDMERIRSVDTARHFFEKLQLDNPSDDTLRRKTALLHRCAGNLRRFMGVVEGAESAYQSSIAQWKSLSMDTNNVLDLENYIMTLSDYATYLKRYGTLNDARAQLNVANTLAASPAFGTSRRSNLDRTLGVVLADRADVEYRLGDYETAVASSLAGAASLNALNTVDPREKNPSDPILQAGAYHTQADALRELGKIEAARVAYHAAIVSSDRAGGAKGNADARYMTAKATLGWAELADRESAFVDFKTSIESLEQLVKEFPRRLFYQEALAEAHLLRGKLYAACNDLKAANDDYQQALTITRKLVDTPPQLADHFALRGQIFIALGHITTPPAKANEEFAKAVRLLTTAQSKDPGNALTNLALGQAKGLLQEKR